MLNAQREQYLKDRPEVIFTRRLVLAILCSAWIAPGMMMLERLPFWSVLMTTWLLMTLGLVPGVFEGKKWVCALLGVVCVAGGGVAFGIVMMASPGDLIDTTPPGLVRTCLSYWAWFWSPAYVVLGCTLIYSRRVDRAVTLYFGL